MTIRDRERGATKSGNIGSGQHQIESEAIHIALAWTLFADEGRK